MPFSLVVLESAAKCSKVEGFLGEGYKCVASYGHIRELKGLDAIRTSPDGRLTLSYSISQGKAKRVQALKAAARKAGEVVLATDDDREGEAIAWHVREMLGLAPETKRIVFNALTLQALRTAMANPRVIDMDRVHAQQAREVIDLTVGFRISPVLWASLSRKTKRGLSAGRCQTPALRLVADNDVEAKNATTRSVYTVTGVFTSARISFRLDKELDDDTSAQSFMDAIPKHTDYEFKRGMVRSYKESAPPPFTTSVMQQTASSQLGMAPKRTMSVAQKLYEAGHITYMRTDSRRLAPEFVSAAAGVVRLNFGDRFVKDNLAGLSEGEAAAGAQDAHEAIRPTHAGRRELPGDTEPACARLYTLIWKRSIAACMADAEEKRFKATIAAPMEMLFCHTPSLLVFTGWKAAHGEKEEDDAFAILQALPTGSVLPPSQVDARVSVRGGKPRYTESSLIRKLESLGIGRPSTFAAIVSKIQERGYVRVGDVAGAKVRCKEFRWESGWAVAEASLVERTFGSEKKKLVLQALGRSVVDLLESNFREMFEYDYTAGMESTLDAIAQGRSTRDAVCAGCSDSITRLLGETDQHARMAIRIDGAHQYIIGRHGPVVKHTDAEGQVSFKAVRDGIDPVKLEAGEYELDEVLVTSTPSKKLGEHEGKPVVLKSGRYGFYVEWNGTKRSVPTTIGVGSDITLEAVLPLVKSTKGGVIRQIDKYTSVRSGPHGDYIFHKKPGWKKPRFIPLKDFIKAHGVGSYKECPVSQITEWLGASQGITCTEEGSERGTSAGSRRGAGRTRGSGQRGRRGNSRGGRRGGES